MVISSKIFLIFMCQYLFELLGQACVFMFIRTDLLTLFNLIFQTGRRILQIIVKHRNIKVKKKKKLSTFNLLNNSKFLMNQ